MKHFKSITLIITAALILLFAGNVLFLVQLYGSIKARYIDDIEQSLRRADLIELIGRVSDAGYGHDGIIDVWTGLQKSDIGAAGTPEELRKLNYSQGYKRMDRQLISVITKYLHDTYGGIGRPDTRELEEIFRRELAFSGYFPEEIIILGEDECAEMPADLWELEHSVDGKLIYQAYISPLTESVLREMSGIIVTSALIALVVAVALWYLLHVISRQRSIEEMKDDFTNNMTHELKTPIAIAYAANDSLLQFPDPADEERTRKYLTAALEQLTKLAGLVENILAMSMERRKHLTMSKRNILLRPFLENIISQQRIGVEKPCTFALDCPEDASVSADPTHFANVISNLIDNSIKYSGEEVEIRILADSNFLSVSDNGIGIPSKALPELFKKFYRVPHGNRADVRGYGIGLFYVKSIVDKHGWNISVESTVGRGTTFTIKFSRP